jgi:AsmA protein
VKRIIRWLAILVGLVLVVLLSAPLWLNASQFKPMLETDLSRALGREVKVGELKLAVFSGSVTTNDVTVSDDPIFNRTPFVQAKSLSLAIELWPLIFSRKLIVTGLTIDHPEIVLLQSPAGDWNFSKLGSSGSAPPASTPSSSSGGGLDLSVKLVKITGARFTLGKTGGKAKPLVLNNLNAELHDYSSTTVFPFTLSTDVDGGGSIALEGKAGPIDGTDVAATPVDATLKIAQLDLTRSGVVTTPGVAGILSFEGSGNSKGADVKATGKVMLDKLKLSKTGTPASKRVELDFAVRHDPRRHSGAVERGDIHIGKAVCTLTGTYAEQGDATVVRMRLSGPDMPIPELASFLPAMGVVLPAGSSLEGGTATAKFVSEGPTDRLVTTGSLTFNNTRLAGFDLGKKMTAVETLAGIQATPDTTIQTLSANLRMAPEGIDAEQLQLIVPSLGELHGGGTVSPANALDFRMTVAVHSAGMLAAINNQAIPVLVSGTCSDPVFRPDVKAVAKQEL